MVRIKYSHRDRHKMCCGSDCGSYYKQKGFSGSENCWFDPDINCCSGDGSGDTRYEDPIDKLYGVGADNCKGFGSHKSQQEISNYLRKNYEKYIRELRRIELEVMSKYA